MRDRVTGPDAPSLPSESISLSVRTVIGDPGPLGSVMLIPLISDWKVPRQCIWSLTGDPCDRMLTRLYILNEPLHGFGGEPDGFKVVGACREHHEQLSGASL